MNGRRESPAFPALMMSLVLCTLVILIVWSLGGLDRLTRRRLSIRYRRPVRRFVLRWLKRLERVMDFSNRLAKVGPYFGKVLPLRPQVAVRGLYNAARDGKRKQTIRSCQWTIDAAAEAFGGIIPLDPFADRNPKHHFAVTNWSRGSLRRVWDAKSYSNPPFDQFQVYLAYARAQALHTGLPTLMIGPWRSHRRGFMDAIQGALCIYFKAFAFRGQTNTTPFPCFLAAWHVDFPVTRYEVDRKQW